MINANPAMLLALADAGYLPLSHYLESVTNTSSGVDCSGVVTAPTADSRSATAGSPLPSGRLLNFRRAGRTQNNQASAPASAAERV